MISLPDSEEQLLEDVLKKALKETKSKWLNWSHFETFKIVL